MYIYQKLYLSFMCIDIYTPAACNFSIVFIHLLISLTSLDAIASSSAASASASLSPSGAPAAIRRRRGRGRSVVTKAPFEHTCPWHAEPRLRSARHDAGGALRYACAAGASAATSTAIILRMCRIAKLLRAKKAKSCARVGRSTMAGMGKNTELEDVPQDVRFPVEEDKVLAYWDEIDAFQTSLRMSREKKNPAFTFYDGPPFATGMPHYGHILAGTIKDCVTRYWHMNGFHVERRWGWDTHGLPIEFEIDQKLKIKGRQDVLDMTVKVYNAECRAVVMKYASEWKRVVRRLARWIDMENDYKTLDPTFMESVWWVCKQVINVVYACVRAPAPTLRALAPILKG